MDYQLTGDGDADLDVGIILPTYCEADNIGKLIREIIDIHLNASILVIDDSSPDGTAQAVQELQKEYGNVHLFVRPKKSGLGSAITDGFKIYLSSRNVPKKIIVMDADYSHNPQDLPALISNMEDGCGIVIGSRYIEGGKIVGWPMSRKIISRVANSIARSSLSLSLHDCTSGFRCYSTDFLKVAAGNLHSHTYEIQIETIRQAVLKDFKVKEIPVYFVNRKKGKSKLSRTEITSFLSYVFKTALHK
jgi:dolichol-phosphate mannosyltransferase